MPSRPEFHSVWMTGNRGYKIAGQLSMKIPLDAEILALLEESERKTAGDLESEVLDFKPWQDVKDSKKVAVEYAACLANTSAEFDDREVVYSENGAFATTSG